MPSDVDQNVAISEVTLGIGRIVQDPSGIQTYNDIPRVYNTYDVIPQLVPTYNAIPEAPDLMPATTEVAFWKQQIVGVESGTISESASVRVTVVASDTGTGYDTASPGVRPLVTDSSGPITDTGLLQAKYVSLEYGSAVEYTSQIIYAFDQLNTVEAAIVQEGINDYNGTVTETVIITAAISSADVGTDSEIAQGGDFIEADDQATAIEVAAVAPGRLSDSDAGHAAEDQSLVVALPVSDVVVVVDTASARVMITSADSGVGIDSSSPITTNISVTDLGSGSDIAWAVAFIIAADAGTVYEVASMLLQSSDIGVCLDLASLVAAIIDADYGYATEIHDRYPPYVLFPPIPAGYILEMAMGEIINTSPVGVATTASSPKGTFARPARGRILH